MRKVRFLTVEEFDAWMREAETKQHSTEGHGRLAGH
jgi:hypothetical protein